MLFENSYATKSTRNRLRISDHTFASSSAKKWQTTLAFMENSYATKITRNGLRISDHTFASSSAKKWQMTLAFMGRDITKKIGSWISRPQCLLLDPRNNGEPRQTYSSTCSCRFLIVAALDV